MYPYRNEIWSIAVLEAWDESFIMFGTTLPNLGKCTSNKIIALAKI